MNIKEITLVVIIAPITSLHAATSNSTTLTVKGQIYRAACEIGMKSKDFTVYMKQFSTNYFRNVNDASDPVPFQIELTDCPATTGNASVKFDGQAVPGNSNLLRLDDVPGSASGVGVAIYDASGMVLPLWTPSYVYPLHSGDNVLNFTARYVASQIPVTPGVAQATSDFTINYS